MARKCAGRESARLCRAGDRRPPGLRGWGAGRRAESDERLARSLRRGTVETAGRVGWAAIGAAGAAGRDFRASGGTPRGADADEDGGIACRAETGEGGRACRRGLLVLTLVLAGAAATAQPLVSPADEAALRGLLPDADRFELHDRGPRHFRAFAAPEAGAAPRLIGLAFFTTDLAPRIYAYKGRITSLVAMDPGGRLIGVRVVHHYEPFGYFSIDLPGFAPQFAGKSILEPLEVGGDIDAVSRATITMEAATRAIRQGARQLARDFLAEQSADR